MVRRSVQRLTTTLIVVLSLLFSQLALANYVCPEPAHSPAEMPAMQMGAREPCESMGMAAGMEQDQDQPVLCHQHCTNAPQSFDPVNLPAVSLPAVVQGFMVPLLFQPAAADLRAYGDVGQARPPPDPLFLSTLRLRV
jgi:hypothetical protein